MQNCLVLPYLCKDTKSKLSCHCIGPSIVTNMELLEPWPCLIGSGPRHCRMHGWSSCHDSVISPRKMDCKRLGQKHCYKYSLMGTQQANLCFCQLLTLNLSVPVPLHKCCSCRTHRDLGKTQLCLVAQLREQQLWSSESICSIPFSAQLSGITGLGVLD